MQIILHFPDGPIVVDIRLIDNPAVKSWAEWFLKDGYDADAHCETPFHVWPRDDVLLQEYVGILNDRVQKLREIGYDYQSDMPQHSSEITRDWTNSLHRFFTHTQRKVFDMLDPARMYLYDQETISLRDRTNLLLEDVNEYVHRVERYLPPSAVELPMNDVNIIYDSNAIGKGWWQILPEWRQYHTKDHADVILGSQILGKTIIKSYIDGDDPNDWDTTGHYANFGAIKLQLGPTRRQDIYDSEDFHKWLGDHGLSYDTAWFDFPLGNVIDRSMIPALIQKFAELLWLSVSVEEIFVADWVDKERVHNV